MATCVYCQAYADGGPLVLAEITPSGDVHRHACPACAIRALLRAIDLTLTRNARALADYPEGADLLPFAAVLLSDGKTTIKVGMRSGTSVVSLANWTADAHERIRQNNFPLTTYTNQLKVRLTRFIMRAPPSQPTDTP